MACISCGNKNISVGECYKCASNRELLEEAKEQAERAKQQAEIEADVHRGIGMVFKTSGFTPMQMSIAYLATQCLVANPKASAEDAVHMARKIFDLSK